MKAAHINQYGNIDKLIIGEVNKPEITEEQVLIKVVAAGVNPVDFHIRNGMLEEINTHVLPLVLGWDAAGVIVEVGEQVTDLNIGDEVYVYTPLTEQGTQAEFVAVDANLIAHKPKSLSFIESAAIPLAALTALQGLTDEGKLQSGQTVLIHNAAGGVGSFAVQIAKQIGAYVIGTGSIAKKEYILGLGADEFIDYKQDCFEDRVTNVDLVFAAISGDNIVERSLSVIKKNGRLITLLEEIPADKASRMNIHYNRMIVTPSRAGLNKLTDLVESNALKVTIDSVFTLDQATEAMKRSESARATGKIVISVIDEEI